MFSIDCMQNKGVPLSVCKHNYFVGTCCRLPDYNNFVGIVYDLRDTETNQLLEARKASASELASFANAAKAEAILSANGTTSTPSTTTQSPISQQQQSISQIAQWLSQAPETTTGGANLPHLSTAATTARLDEKYIIASTSLFSPTARPNSLSNPIKEAAAAASSETARNADGQVPTPLAGSSNNLRPVQSLDLFQVQLSASVAPSNNSQSDSVQHGNEVESKRINEQQMQNAYELVKDESQNIKVLSSAHSAPAALKQQPQLTVSTTLSLPPFDERNDVTPHSGDQYQQQASNKNVGVLASSGNQSTTSSKQPSDIVVANNHRLSSSSGSRLSIESLDTGANNNGVISSDQEFALTSVNDSEPVVVDRPQRVQSSTTTAKATPPASQSTFDHVTNISEPSSFATTPTTTTTTSTTTKLVVSSPSANEGEQQMSETINLMASQYGGHSVSTFATVQTTTPFTSSLSTASIPNISIYYPPSSSYNPSTPDSALSAATTTTTTPAPSSPEMLVSSSAAPIKPAQSATLSPTSSASLQSSASTTTSTVSSSSPASSLATGNLSTMKPSSTPTTHEPTTLGQLYSNQHSTNSYQHLSPGHSNINQHPGDHYQPFHLLAPGHQSVLPVNNNNNNNLGLPHISPRPSLGGSSSSTMQAASKIVTGSSTSNIIPGLSGLQSAILSHIPFKIASGLSSGLSSYLQAAMKPTASRPLISSNNAPALQYQQQLANNSSGGQSNKATTSTISIVNNSPIRFPEGGSSTSSSSSDKSSTSQTSASSSSHHNPFEGRDTQRICGKPQVSPSDSHHSNSKKRVARIVGGNQSLFGQWPWMVSLRQWRKGAFLHKCGAALLNENWAITAAHCVEK